MRKKLVPKYKSAHTKLYTHNLAPVHTYMYIPIRLSSMTYMYIHFVNCKTNTPPKTSWAHHLAQRGVLTWEGIIIHKISNTNIHFLQSAIPLRNTMTEGWGGGVGVERKAFFLVGPGCAVMPWDDYESGSSPRVYYICCHWHTDMAKATCTYVRMHKDIYTYIIRDRVTRQPPSGALWMIQFAHAQSQPACATASREIQKS